MGSSGNAETRFLLLQMNFHTTFGSGKFFLEKAYGIKEKGGQVSLSAFSCSQRYLEQEILLDLAVERSVIKEERMRAFVRV